MQRADHNRFGSEAEEFSDTAISRVRDEEISASIHSDIGAHFAALVLPPLSRLCGNSGGKVTSAVDIQTRVFGIH